MMQSFDDFDAWGEAIRGADLRLACDRVETPEWKLGQWILGRSALQVATEGGGNLCYGGNTHAGTILFIPLERSDAHVGNGEQFDDATMLAITPGSDFCIRVPRRAHAWCSVALPPDVIPAGGGPVSRVIRSALGPMRRLKSLVLRIAASPALPASVGPAHAAAEAELFAAVGDCFSGPATDTARLGRPKFDRLAIVRRTQEILESETLGRPSVAELAMRVGVTERTLGRAFHDVYGVSPLTYMQLRLLHQVRRALRSAASDDTVASVLVRYGVWDFGRFNARYRRHFGETLSETLAK